MPTESCSTWPGSLSRTSRETEVEAAFHSEFPQFDQNIFTPGMRDFEDTQRVSESRLRVEIEEAPGSFIDKGGEGYVGRVIIPSMRFAARLRITRRRRGRWPEGHE